MIRLLKCVVVLAALMPAWAVSSAQADRIYSFPRASGAILDHCWTWARNCGRARANWYCRAKGHPGGARSYSTYRPGRTFVVGSGRYCTGGGCVGYRRIRCITGGGGGGVGNKVSYCRAYAQRAVNHQRTNRSRRCGGFGTRWQSNYGNHYNWCMRVAPSRARSEDNARLVRLRRCGASGGGGGVGNKVTFCRNYAQRAVNAQRANRARRCGGFGTRWQSNYGNHYNWCMRVAPGRARSEDRARQVRLSRCGASGGGACANPRPACGWWNGRRYNFANICQLRRRGARLIRYGRCGGGGGGAGQACFVGNARVSAASPGCSGSQSARIPFPFRRMRHGQSWRMSVNSGVITRGAPPHGVCNFHSNIVYRCFNGRLRIQAVTQCTQARTRNASCRVSQ